MAKPLTEIQHNVLRHVRECPDGTTVHRLGKHFLMGSHHARSTLDRLCTMGLLRRREEPYRDRVRVVFLPVPFASSAKRTGKA